MSWDDDDYGSSSSSSSSSSDSSSSSSSSSNSRDDDDYRPSRSSSSSSSSNSSNKSRDDDDDYFLKSVDDPFNILGGGVNKKSTSSSNGGSSLNRVVQMNDEDESRIGHSGSVRYNKVVEPEIVVEPFDLFTYESIKQLAVSAEDIYLVTELNKLYNDFHVFPYDLDTKIIEVFHSNLALYEALLDIEESRKIILNNDYYLEEGYGIGKQIYSLHYCNNTYLLDYVREYLIYHSTYIDEIGYSSGASDKIDSYGSIKSPYFNKDSIEEIYTDYLYWW